MLKYSSKSGYRRWWCRCRRSCQAHNGPRWGRSRTNAFRAVPALVQFVRTLPPADLLAVYGVMDSVRDVRFTRDRAPAIVTLRIGFVLACLGLSCA